MAVRRLAFAICAVLVANLGARAEGVQACSDEFWRRATTVATGHGTGFEIEARQIGRARCDCTYVAGKPKTCTASVVSVAEAVRPQAIEVDR
jgi:hypothetical protein